DFLALLRWFTFSGCDLGFAFCAGGGVVPVVLGTHHSVAVVAGFDSSCLPSNVAGGDRFAFCRVHAPVVVDDDSLGCVEVGVAYEWVELVDVDEHPVDHCCSVVHVAPPSMACRAGRGCRYGLSGLSNDSSPLRMRCSRS